MKLWAVPADVDRMIGRSLRCYRLVERIGSGGMGVVYRAAHLRLPREVAIKVLKPKLAEDSALVERFLQEARAVNQIRHPNLVEVFDVDEEPGDPPLVYMVMELLDGVDLARQIRTHGRIDALRAVAIGDAVADALVAVHRHRILHRDLKAENIFLVRREDGGLAVKLLDFGIAASLEAGVARLTAPGAFLGTPENMAPEQITGKALDERTDIYSFGIVLYQMLGGSVPFRAEHASGVFSQQLETSPAPLLGGAREEIPEALSAVVMRCLEKRPADRYASITEVRQALWAAIGAPGGQSFYSSSQPANGLAEATTWHPVATPARPRRALSRRRVGLLACAMAAATLAVWLAAGSNGGSEPGTRHQAARREPERAAFASSKRAAARELVAGAHPAVPQCAATRACPSLLAARGPRRPARRALPATGARPAPPAARARPAPAARAAGAREMPSALDRTIDPFRFGMPPLMQGVASGRQP